MQDPYSSLSQQQTQAWLHQQALGLSVVLTTDNRTKAFQKCEITVSPAVEALLPAADRQQIQADLMEYYFRSSMVPTDAYTEGLTAGLRAMWKKIAERRERGKKPYSMSISLDGNQYKDGDTVIVKREHKKEVILTAFQHDERISKLSWSVKDKNYVSTSITVDASTVSTDAAGQTVTALWGSEQVTVNVVVAEVILPRSVTMAVRANLYPIISPEGIADKITFESGNEQVLSLSEGYPILELTAGKPGETTVTAKAGKTVFYQRTIKVIEEPDIEFSMPTISSVKFENVSLTSINYNIIKLTELGGGGLNGLCSPEAIKISNPPFFYLKEDKWYPYIDKVEGEYFFDWRLIEGQQEVTGPGGNTTEDNYCEQIMVMGSIPKYNHGPDYRNYYDRQKAAGQPIWYMLEAVRAHEKVHEPDVIDAFLNGGLKDSITLYLKKELIFDDQPHKSFSEIENENFVILDYAIDRIQNELIERWLDIALKYAGRDHNPGGAAEQAEYVVIDPMIDQICNYAKIGKWKTCEPDICNSPIPFGAEIPYIVDVTDLDNPVSYDLDEYVSIAMNDRQEIRLRFRIANSMVVAKDVSWQLTFDEKQMDGMQEIIFKKDQLKDTPEIISISYQDGLITYDTKTNYQTQWTFSIKK